MNLKKSSLFQISHPQHFQQEKIRPRNIQTHKKLLSEQSSTDGYIILLKGYARSPFQVYESYLRIVVGLGEDVVETIQFNFCRF